MSIPFREALWFAAACAAVTQTACGSNDVRRHPAHLDADAGDAGEAGASFTPPADAEAEVTRDANDGSSIPDATADAPGPGFDDAEAGLKALAVATRGRGTGSVRSDPEGIDCEAPCSASFPPGSTVTLTAVSGEHSRFSGWTGACTALTPTCTVTMDEARSVEAVFSLEQFPLVVRKTGSGGGTVTADSGALACGATCAGSYDYASRVTLTALPDENSVFGGWTNCPAPAGVTCVVGVAAVLEVSATFTPAQRTLQVARAGTGTGTVTSAPAGIACGADCSEVYAHGTNVVLTATPNPTNYFSGFTGCPSPSGFTCSVSMTASRDVTATFAANQAPTVTISSPLDGGRPIGETSYEAATGRWYTLVTLTGSALDPEDGSLPGGSLAWTTDQTAVQPASLGSGASITVALYKPDECITLVHHITLTATDSRGRSTARTITFNHSFFCS